MIVNKCFVCGSRNLRADRALSGRLVCNACGTPYGVGIRRSKNKNHINTLASNYKYLFFLFLLILAFILVII